MDDIQVRAIRRQTWHFLDYSAARLRACGWSNYSSLLQVFSCPQISSYEHSRTA
jgi:hypothetical protein